MTDRQLVSGAPVPTDRSHTALKPNGQQQDYVVLSPEERAKGFVKPVRNAYIHSCGVVTTMGSALAETYARDPHFYSGTFCCGCRAHFPLNQFTWDKDGEPMDPALQEEWNDGRAEREAAQQDKRKKARIDYLRGEIQRMQAELAELDKPNDAAK